MSCWTSVVIFIIAAALVVLAAPAPGETVRVERDGTGDFTTIQAAIDAAAVGDTIQLGPGRYTEFAAFSTSGWTENTYAAVTVDSLTLIGTNRETVIIGPVTSSVQGIGPKGIVLSDHVTSFRLRSVTVEHLYDGCYLVGSVGIRDCRFVECSMGVSAFTNNVLTIETSEFLGNTVAGLVATDHSGSVLVDRCRFAGDFLAGAMIARTTNAEIRDCAFVGSRVGVELSEGTTGLIVRSTFSGHANGGVALLDGVVGTIAECTFQVMPYNIWVLDGSTLRGHGNSLFGGSLATLRFWSNSTADFHDNDIWKGGGASVLAEVYVTVPIGIDLTNNYWGTTEPDSIAAWVVDGNDLHVPVIDPNFSNVIFEPFLMRSIPTKTESMGSLKSRFSGQH